MGVWSQREKRDLKKNRSSHTATRASWARLLRKILEVDPLLCPRCCVQMKIVSIIIDPAVVDQIIRHLAHAAAPDPFEERPPPRSAGPPLAPLTP